MNRHFHFHRIYPRFLVAAAQLAAVVEQVVEAVAVKATTRLAVLEPALEVVVVEVAAVKLDLGAVVVLVLAVASAVPLHRPEVMQVVASLVVVQAVVFEFAAAVEVVTAVLAGRSVVLAVALIVEVPFHCRSMHYPIAMNRAMRHLTTLQLNPHVYQRLARLAPTRFPLAPVYRAASSLNGSSRQNGIGYKLLKANAKWLTRIFSRHYPASLRNGFDGCSALF